MPAADLPARVRRAAADAVCGLRLPGFGGKVYSYGDWKAGNVSYPAVVLSQSGLRARRLDGTFENLDNLEIPVRLILGARKAGTQLPDGCVEDWQYLISQGLNGLTPVPGLPEATCLVADAEDYYADRFPGYLEYEASVLVKAIVWVPRAGSVVTA